MLLNKWQQQCSKRLNTLEMSSRVRSARRLRELLRWHQPANVPTKISEMELTAFDYTDDEAAAGQGKIRCTLWKNTIGRISMEREREREREREKERE